MSENAPDPRRSPGAEVPRLYIDAADVRVLPHSLHLLLGALDLQADPVVAVHLTMSPTFAVQLSRALAEAVRPYLPADPPTEPEPPR